MAVTVLVPGPLRTLTAGASQVTVEADTVAGLVEALEALHPGFRDRLYDGAGRLRGYVRLFVNEEDVRTLGETAAPLVAGDRVAIVPAIAGGAA